MLLNLCSFFLILVIVFLTEDFTNGCYNFYVY